MSSTGMSTEPPCIRLLRVRVGGEPNPYSAAGVLCGTGSDDLLS